MTKTEYLTLQLIKSNMKNKEEKNKCVTPPPEEESGCHFSPPFITDCKCHLPKEGSENHYYNEDENGRCYECGMEQFNFTIDLWKSFHKVNPTIPKEVKNRLQKCVDCGYSNSSRVNSCQNCGKPFIPSVESITKSKDEISLMHSFLRHKYGKATYCCNEDCSGKCKVFNWCKLRGHEYTTNPKDYVWLCTSCHRFYDWNDIRDKIVDNKKMVIKLSFDDVEKIREMVKKGIMGVDIAKIYNVHKTTIYQIIKEKTWRMKQIKMKFLKR